MRKKRNEIEIEGRVHVDLFVIISSNPKTREYERLDLKSVCEYLGIVRKSERKIIDSASLGEILETSPGEILQYVKDDVWATKKLAENFLPQELELSKIINLPINIIYRAGTSNLIEAAMLREYSAKNYLFPEKKSVTRPFEGGYVALFYRGIFQNIAKFDVTSLYPSIMEIYKIFPTNDVEQVFLRKLMEFKRRRLFLKKTALKTGNKFLDIRQNALKILINGMYGYLGYEKARFGDLDKAELVTYYGRLIIKKIIQLLSNEGLTVLEADTDGIFMVGNTKDEYLKLLKKVNSILPKGIVLEFDGFFPSGVFLEKKNYALLTENDTIILKGSGLKTKRYSRFLRKLFREVLLDILKDQNFEVIKRKVKAVLKRILRRQLSKYEICQKARLTRPVDSYKAQPEHVKVAQKLLVRNFDIKPGDVIEYYITTMNKELVTDRAESIHFFKPENVDIDYYYNFTIESLSEIIAKCYNVNVEIIKQQLDFRQQTLFTPKILPKIVKVMDFHLTSQEEKELERIYKDII
jgi:DNA polymerase elongation subunit (family B)